MLVEITEVVVAILMVVASVLIHGAGLFWLARALRLVGAEEHRRHVGMDSPRAVFGLLAIVLGLFVLHGVEIWGWALVYVAADAIPDLRTAVYASCFVYATIGYDEALIPEAWRLLVAIEGITGILLLGWTTGFFVSVVTHVRGT
jgi:hypothetical protein